MVWLPHGRLWWRDNSYHRLRFSVIHPMDTGLAAGIPVFYLEDIELKDQEGPLALIRPFEPISENPVFTLNVPNEGQVLVSGRDNNGNRIQAAVPPPPNTRTGVAPATPR